ncbi:MAG TPA: flagellar filament capping protein FliD [Bryobacteraceae bacterium]|nr:flagellar filament capping protein FliD [Bryobacteraceae bacterium]
MSTSSTSAGSFTGASSFSSSLGQAITRAVAIASLPMQNLQTQQSALQNQQSELGTLTTRFSSLGTALTSVDTAATNGSYSGTLSNTAVGSASVTSGALPGTFSLSVSNVGAYENTMSNDAGVLKVTDPSKTSLSTGSSFTLSINSTQYQITDSTNTLNGLAQAINTSGANVQATVVNVGSSSSPDYRLSIQNLEYAPDTVQLTDDSNNNAPMLTELTPGAYVTYQVNGATAVNSTTRSLDLATGVTVNVSGAGSTTVTISQTSAGLVNALTNFANAYNSAVDEVNKNRGQSGGALTGDSAIYSVTSMLNNLTSYTSASGSIASLSDIGLTFDQSGHLNFDATAFQNAVSANSTDVMNFLGSASADTGFLGTANDILTGINDSSTGILTQSNDSLTSQISKLGDQITADQNQVNLLQQNLVSQMAAADAAISTLEQQANFFQMMFQTQNANAQLGF